MHGIGRFWCVFGVVAGLLALPFQAGADDAAARGRAGALLWEMSELHHEFGDRHIARGVTPEKARKMAASTAGSLADKRDDLAELLPQLSPDTRFAADLARFLQKWPDRQTFLEDLLVFYNGAQSGVDITSLAMQVSDTRRGWKTPFPMFRP